MRSLVAAAVLTLVALAAPAGAEEPKKPEGSGEKKPAAETKPAAPAKPAAGAESPKAFHTVGLAIAKSLEVFSLTPAELEQVLKGVRDGATGKAKTDLTPEQQQAVNELARTRMAKTAEKAKAQNPAYLSKMEKEKGAFKTASGAIVIPTLEGKGASPAEADTVKVHYTGKLTDGKVFDSSVARGQPAEFPLNGVIKCWTEGLQKMKVGGKATLVCPPEIAYGEQGRPPQIPPASVLTFDVELLDVKPAAAASQPAKP
jgi:FKBP-type peptidyl-prolyl cis-trans isomerase